MIEQHSGTEDYENRWKFNGKELDTETGLYYYGARYYDPSVSIWMSVDPLAEKGPQYSPYNYTFNNPINFTDPDGRWPDPPTWKKFKNLYPSLSKNSTIFIIQEIPKRNSSGNVMSVIPNNRKFQKILLNKGRKAGSPMIYLTESISSTTAYGPGFSYTKHEGETTTREIGFVGNRNELLNDNFSDIAQNIIETGSIVDIQGRTQLGDGQILNSGATINGEERMDYTTNDLVQSRAETIYNKLIDLNVPADQLNVVPAEYNSDSNSTVISINQKPELIGIKPEQIKE